MNAFTLNLRGYAKMLSSHGGDERTAGMLRMAADEIDRIRGALQYIVQLDHHNHGPESRATTAARAALNGGSPQ